MDTQVVVVGGGPVGLTLAIDLGRRGVRCTLIEQREAPQFLPKMERCNARTMEILRRIGIADRARAAGLRADIPMDVFIVLSLAEPPLVHLSYPSVEEARAQIRACRDGSLPLEPYQPISQYTLEPLLKSIADRLLRLGRTAPDSSGLEKALRASGAPLTVLAVPDGAAREVYGYDLVLVRPDLHVVWRGNQPPEEPGEVARIATGHGAS
jgi:hypothetical protein